MSDIIEVTQINCRNRKTTTTTYTPPDADIIDVDQIGCHKVTATQEYLNFMHEFQNMVEQFRNFVPYIGASGNVNIGYYTFIASGLQLTNNPVSGYYLACDASGNAYWIDGPTGEFVPYTGALSGVDLGSFDLTADIGSFNSITISSSGEITNLNANYLQGYTYQNIIDEISISGYIPYLNQTRNPIFSLGRGIDYAVPNTTETWRTYSLSSGNEFIIGKIGLLGLIRWFNITGGGDAGGIGTGMGSDTSDFTFFVNTADGKISSNHLSAWDAETTTDPGSDLLITGGTGGSLYGNGGNLILQGGTVTGASGNGGSLYFKGSDGDIPGTYNFKSIAGNVYGTLDFESVAGWDKVYTFPNISGTVAVISNTSPNAGYFLLSDDNGYPIWGNSTTNPFTFNTTADALTINATGVPLSIRNFDWTDTTNLTEWRNSSDQLIGYVSPYGAYFSSVQADSVDTPYLSMPYHDGEYHYYNFFNAYDTKLLLTRYVTHDTSGDLSTEYWNFNNDGTTEFPNSISIYNIDYTFKNTLSTANTQGLNISYVLPETLGATGTTLAINSIDESGNAILAWEPVSSPLIFTSPLSETAGVVSIELSSYALSADVASGFVPYVGANNNVDLGIYELTTSNITVSGSGIDIFSDYNWYVSGSNAGIRLMPSQTNATESPSLNLRTTESPASGGDTSSRLNVTQAHGLSIMVRDLGLGSQQYYASLSKDNGTFTASAFGLASSWDVNRTPTIGATFSLSGSDVFLDTNLRFDVEEGLFFTTTGTGLTRYWSAHTSNSDLNFPNYTEFLRFTPAFNAEYGSHIMYSGGMDVGGALKIRKNNATTGRLEFYNTADDRIFYAYIDPYNYADADPWYCMFLQPAQGLGKDDKYFIIKAFDGYTPGATLVSINKEGQIESHLSKGYSPFIVASDTRVDNLNVQYLNGYEDTHFEVAVTTGTTGQFYRGDKTWQNYSVITTGLATTASLSSYVPYTGAVSAVDLSGQYMYARGYYTNPDGNVLIDDGGISFYPTTPGNHNVSYADDSSHIIGKLGITSIGSNWDSYYNYFTTDDTQFENISYILPSSLGVTGTTLTISSIDASGNAILAWESGGEAYTFNSPLQENAGVVSIELSSYATTASLSAYEQVSRKETGTAPSSSNVNYPSSYTVKTYVDTMIASANALVYKGTINCSANPNYPPADAGWLYVVSVSGKIGGASGVNVEQGDMCICNTDGSSGGTQAEVGPEWNIIEKNIDGAVTGPASSYSDNIALFDGVTGKVIKDAGVGLSTYATTASLTAYALSSAVSANYVPYIGAVSGVDLNSQNITAGIADLSTINAVDIYVSNTLNLSGGANFGIYDTYAGSGIYTDLYHQNENLILNIYDDGSNDHYWYFNMDGTTDFPGDITAPIGNFDTITVTSTGMITNLNSEYLSGYDANTFLPNGNNTSIQYNDNGFFGGDANLVWDKTTQRQSIIGGTTITASASDGDTTVFDIKDESDVSRFKVDNLGNVTMSYDLNSGPTTLLLDTPDITIMPRYTGLDSPIVEFESKTIDGTGFSSCIMEFESKDGESSAILKQNSSYHGYGGFPRPKEQYIYYNTQTYSDNGTDAKVYSDNGTLAKIQTPSGGHGLGGSWHVLINDIYNTYIDNEGRWNAYGYMFIDPNTGLFDTYLERITSNEISLRDAGNGPGKLNLGTLTVTSTGEVSNLNTQYHQGFLVQGYSVGFTTMPSLTEDGSGGCTISSGTVRLYDNPSGSGQLKEYSVASGAFSFADASNNYIICSLSGTTAILSSTTDVSLINESNVAPVYTVYRDGLLLYKLPWTSLAQNLDTRLHYRLVKTDRFGRQSGLTLTTTGLTAQVASGIVFYGVDQVNVAAFDSSTDYCYLLHHTGGNWTKTATSQLNNNYYDDGNDLTPLSINRIAVNWIYRAINSDYERCCIVPGQGDYTMTQAIESQPPTNLPAPLMAHFMLVGRAIVRKSATEAEVIYSEFEEDTHPSEKRVNDGFNVSTGNGVVSGMALSISGSTTFNIAPGYYYIPSSGLVKYAGTNDITATQILSGVATYVALDIDENVIQQLTPFTNAQRRDYVLLGAVVHSNRTSLNAVNNLPDVAIKELGQYNDLLDALKMFNTDGNLFSAFTTAGTAGNIMALEKTSGHIFKRGVNFNSVSGDVNNPHIRALDPASPLTVRFRTQDTSIEPESADTTNISGHIGYYDLNGVKTAVGANNYTIMRIAIFSSGLVRIQYGQTVYNKMSDAKAGLLTETFVPEPNILQNGLYRAVLIVKTNATDLTDTSQAVIYNLNRFGEIAVGAAGAGGTTDLQGAYNNSLDGTIITDVTRDGFKIQSGVATGNIFLIKDITGTTNLTIDVSGNLTTSGYVDALSGIFDRVQMTTSPTSGYLLTSDESGNGYWTNPLSAYALTDSLSTYSLTSHNHSGTYEPVFSKGTLSGDASGIISITDGTGRLYGANTATITIAKATSGQPGYLSTADFSKFTEAYTDWAATDLYGFENMTDTTISFDGANVFTLAPTGSVWSYFRSGIKYTITGSVTAQLSGSAPATAGAYYIYIDSTNGSLTASTGTWTLQDTKVPVAYVLWDNSATPKYQLADERHTANYPRRVHWEHHFVDGSELMGGGTISGYVTHIDPDGTAITTDNTFGVSATTFSDESILITNSALPDPDGDTAVYMCLHRTGATTYSWMLSEVPYHYTASGYIDWDNNGTLTQGVSGKYYTSYLFYTNFAGDGRYMVMAGRGEYASLSEAEQESPGLFSFSGFPINECILAYKFIWYTDSALSAVRGKCQLVVEPDPIMESIVAIRNRKETGRVRVLDDLADVTISSPTTDQVLKYNGLKWVNGAGTTSSAGNGVIFYDASPTITATGTQNAVPILTFSKTPVTTTTQTITSTSNNNVVAVAAWKYATAIGRTLIDAGIWEFNIYAGVSAAGGRTTYVIKNIYDILRYTSNGADNSNTGIITTAGTGTTRTVTASVSCFTTTNVGTGSTIASSGSYLETASGMFLISARTSDTVVSITTPTTFTNVSSGNFNIWKNLFSVRSPAITNITPAYALYSVNSVQNAYTVGEYDYFGEMTFENNIAGGATTLTITYDGTTFNTNTRTPFVVLHNNLSGLQGGTGSGVTGEFYHLTSAQTTTATQSANASRDGYLTSTKYSEFDGKATTAQLSAYVPYTGAVSAVDLSGQSLTTSSSGIFGRVKMTTSPTSGYVLTSDASGNGYWVQPSAGGGAQVATISFAGVLATYTGQLRWTPPTTVTLSSAIARVTTPSSGAAINYTINVTGTALVSSTITSGTSGGSQISLSSTSIGTGDYITVNIDQVGSTTPGSDLVVSIIYTS
jgi:hypothetical protein